MKIAFFSTKSYDREYFDKFNEEHGFKINYYFDKIKEDDINLTVGMDAVCVFVNDKLDRHIISLLAKNGVKVILLRCAGFNNVDIESATEFGIKVYRVPAYSPHSVAEHAVALILALNRKTHKAFNRIREGNFSLERLNGFDLFKKTVGVIGTGKIGAAFCSIMNGFGCSILAYDKYENEELKKNGIHYTSFKELITSSDIISLHCPLVPETKHIINAKAFSKMKKGVMLINTSRGMLIDTKSAIKALKSKKLGYLGIDVYEQEENLFFQDLSEHIIQDDIIARLTTFPNVLITAHQAFFTNEALSEIARTTLQNLALFMKEEPTTNEVKFGKVR